MKQNAGRFLNSMLFRWTPWVSKLPLLRPNGSSEPSRGLSQAMPWMPSSAREPVDALPRQISVLSVPLSRKIPAGREDFRATDGTRIKHGQGNKSYSLGKRGEASSGNPCLIRVPSVAQDD